MALKQLIISKRIRELSEQLKTLREKLPDFESRHAALKTREAELEASVNEITADTTDEDKAVVDAAVAEFESDSEALETEWGENNAEITRLEDEIRTLQNELDELNKKAAPPPAESRTSDEREDKIIMAIRGKFFSGVTPEQRAAFIARDDVKDFLARVRDMKGQTRAVNGAELTFPEVVLELLRDNLHRYSKLIPKVRVRNVGGQARQTIAGTIPEGVWVEAAGTLNELDFVFNQIEVDCYKVGGFIAVPNSTLEDSDINLADELMDMLGQSIGYAIDKAIVYGDGQKCPYGIVPRLAQSSKPADWNKNAPAWADLRTEHILKIDPAGKTAEQFYGELILALGATKPNYAAGDTMWLMNRKTKLKLMAKAVTFNAAGALVSGQFGKMPIENGDIIDLPFIPDGDIIGGYGSLYLLAERAGAQLAISEHAKFVEDQAVLRGTARYDGKPVLGEAFVIVNIDNKEPTLSLDFAEDTANDELPEA